MPFGKAPSGAGLIYWLPQKNIDPLKVFRKQFLRALDDLIDLSKDHEKLVKKAGIKEGGNAGFIDTKFRERFLENGRKAAEIQRRLHNASSDVVGTAHMDMIVPIISCASVVQRDMDVVKRWDAEEREWLKTFANKRQEEIKQAERVFAEIQEEIKRSA